MEEIWKDVKDYEGLYKVSNFVKVRSLNYRRSGLERNLTLSKERNGYYSVLLTLGKKTKHKKIHRLIAEAFIPNPENKPHVNHINGVKSDNRVENLEWCTRSENQLHAYKIGLKENCRRATKIRSEIISDWHNKNLDLAFNGSAAELIRAFKEQKLDHGHLNKVRQGKEKQHKGWIFVK